VSGRRFVSDLRDALAKGYVSRMPSYNSIFDYFKMASLTPYLKQLIAESALPLRSIETDFAVDHYARSIQKAFALLVIHGLRTKRAEVRQESGARIRGNDCSGIWAEVIRTLIGFLSHQTK
jgi:hypothetical protein